MAGHRGVESSMARPPSPLVTPQAHHNTTSDFLAQTPRSPLPLPANLERSSSAMSAPETVTEDSPLQSAENRVVVTLVSPFTYNLSAGDSKPPSQISAKRHHTVLKIKTAVQKNWPGKPSVEGMRLIHAGRVLKDEEKLGDVISRSQSQVCFHLVVRPDAWTDLSKAPLTPSTSQGPTHPTQQARITSSKPITRKIQPSVDPLEGSSYFTMPSQHQQTQHSQPRPFIGPSSDEQSTESSSSSDVPMRLADIIHMTNLPRALSISYSVYSTRYQLLYQRFQGHEGNVEADHQAIVTAKQRLGIASAASEQAVIEIEKQILGFEPWIDGAIEAGDSIGCRLADCFERLQRIQGLLEQIQEVKARIESRPQGFEPSDANHTNALMAPQPSQQQQSSPQQQAQPTIPAQAEQEPAVPRPTAGEVLNMLIPVAFLTVKLAILLYIFTRSASATKKGIMVGLTCLWILAAAVAAWRKRIRKFRSAWRRAQRAQQAANGTPAPRRASAAAQGSRGRRPYLASSNPAGVPLAPLRFTADSPSRLQYWLQHVAYMGLEQEDIAMGLFPNPSQSRLWMTWVARERLRTTRRQSSSHLARLAAAVSVTSILNDVIFSSFLYLATFSPEVEELRGSARRRRDRLIHSWWTNKGKAWVEKKRRAAAAAKSNEAEGAGSSHTPLGPSDELPRLLKHPHVLRALRLEPTEDGFVAPIEDGAGGTASQGPQIDIQEELDAQREAAQGEPNLLVPEGDAVEGDADADVSGATAAADGEGDQSQGVVDPDRTQEEEEYFEEDEEDAEEDLGFF